MMPVALVEEIIMKVSALPFELQRETLDFVEFISQRAKNGLHSDEATQPAAIPNESKKQFKSVLGSLEHLGIHVALEDIAEVRREMWANFPREEPR